LSHTQRQPAYALAFVLVIAGGIRTWLRSPVWRSNRSLLLTTAERHPEGSWTHAQLGRVFAANGGFSQATDEYRISLAIFDRNPVIWSDAINAAINARRFALADSMVIEAERAVPNHYLVKVAHAHAAFESARFAEALEAARAAIALAPDSVPPRFFAGLAWTGLRVTDSAVAEFNRVPRGHPFRPMTDSVLKNLRGRD
jgi:tetratricopeptide (TPR) repeat protein